MSKYGNRKVTFEGIKFDSMVERSRYLKLLEMEQRGLISKLILQPSFLLVPSFRRNGHYYRAEHYVADFEYLEEGKRIVEDVKGCLTAVYKAKRKHFLSLNPQLIFREVRLKQKSWEITEL